MIRFTASHRCPVCDGYPELARGQGRRCAGFLSDDGAWAHCERDEHAGKLQLDTRTEPATYLHRLDAACRCGTDHGVALAPLNPPAPAVSRRIVQTYPYQDADGRVVYRQVRFEPKGFAPQHPTADGGWQFGLNGVPRVLYRLPELLAAPKRTAFVCEGEKDVDRLVGLGLISTTNCGGSPSWRKHASDYAETFRGRPRVVVLVDNDEPGRHWGQEVARSISAVGTKVSVLELPGLPIGGDVSDWLEHHTVDELKTLATAALAWTPLTSEASDNTATTGLLSLRSLLSQPEWPETLNPAALHGLAGDVVRAIDPHTESDPAAVLASFLTAFGNVVGPDAHVVVGSTQHTARIFTALVGETARARKGDS